MGILLHRMKPGVTLTVFLLLAQAASAQTEGTAPTTATTTTATATTTTTAPAPTTAATAATTVVAPGDVTAPQVLDVSIAADNPLVAPVVTALLLDNVGVASAVAHWRVAGGTWQERPLVGGSGQLFIARLPDGVQKTGFVLWLEVKDAANNGVRIGSDAAPLEVPAAIEGNVERVERQEAADSAFRGPHPAWVMLALGAGIAGTASAGIFVYDLSVLGKKAELVDTLLDSDLSAKRRTELEATEVQLDEAILQDQVLVGILGVIGGAALATGVVLLTVSAIEQ